MSNLSALIAQRGYARPDLYRRIYDLGDRSVSALEPPDPETGLCGTYQPEQLAKGLLSEVNALIEFVVKHGQTPTIIRLQAERIAELQDIRAMIRAELRLLLQGELRTALREDLPALLTGLTISTLPGHVLNGQHESTAGVLTETAPGVASMIESLFSEN